MGSDEPLPVRTDDPVADSGLGEQRFLMAIWIEELFFEPPMAIARLGSSPTPQDAFDWEDDDSPAGGIETVIRPRPSLDVDTDGTVSVRMPDEIRFKDDDGAVRPVAPFFELWARLVVDGTVSEQPVTSRLLRELGAGVDHLRWEVVAANDKAWQRTADPTCRFEARVVIDGTDTSRHPLDAISPVSSGQTPLVPADRPIRLGSVQLTRPTADGSGPGVDPDVDLDVVRLRFTPAPGYCYAPADAIVGVSSPLEPGDMSPTASLYGNIHEIVPADRRTLNAGTPWSKFVMDSMEFPHGTPIDAYDGANVGTSVSWGVVDDSCDALITVRLAIAGRAHTATARVFSGPQDYAPDRRNFHSVIDDLEDRELDSPVVDAETLDEHWDEIVDLFRRVLETASLFNLDMHRAWATGINAFRLGVVDLTADDWDAGTSPRIGPNSMTRADEPYSDKAPDLIPGQVPSMFSEAVGAHGLPYTEIVDFVHRTLADPVMLESFMARRPDHVRELVRPPLGRLSELPPRPGVNATEDVRDPRTLRDRLYDMRMPPYMRDTMGYPLTLTRRQYDILLGVLDQIEARGDPTP
jgi:hypothetical protein